jgi:chemotaxis protein CheZ
MLQASSHGRLVRPTQISSRPESVTVSDLSAGQDALEQLDERVRRLSTTLGELGWDRALHQLADEIPDARERLSYVGGMTEAAATKVLNLVEEAQPACQAAAAEADTLAARLDRLAGHPELGIGEARAALAEAAATLQHQASVARRHAAVLSDIMMSQDFQDLSGQVIQKVVDIITHTEQQLRQLLAQSQGRNAAALDKATLQGPQVPEKAVAQSDVDDLLASLGF